MNPSFVITPRVLNTINALPEAIKLDVVMAIAGEMLLGLKVENEMSAENMLVYSVIKDYIIRDTHKALS